MTNILCVERCSPCDIGAYCLVCAKEYPAENHYRVWLGDDGTLMANGNNGNTGAACAACSPLVQWALLTDETVEQLRKVHQAQQAQPAEQKGQGV